MERAVKYPIGQQSFENLREGGFLYVDKTRYIHKILEGSQYFFLGRPRRFGKSLFLSTLKCFFEGKRHLFKSLWMNTTSRWSTTSTTGSDSSYTATNSPHSIPISRAPRII